MFTILHKSGCSNQCVLHYTSHTHFWIMLNLLLKTCLRHPDCESARVNKEGVFHRMRLALEQVIEIVTDSRPNGENNMAPLSIYTGIKEFKVSLKTVPYKPPMGEKSSHLNSEMALAICQIPFILLLKAQLGPIFSMPDKLWGNPPATSLFVAHEACYIITLGGIMQRALLMLCL